MIQYKATNTKLNGGLQNLLEQKFQSLEKYIGDETDVKCAVEFEKVTTQQSGKVFRTEANLFIAGKLYRADATEFSFEESIEEVRAELDKELRRANKKRDTLMRRGGRKIKKMIRFGGWNT